MSGSSSNAVPIPNEAEMAAAQQTLAWGITPRLYLSYGMVTMKGTRPAAVEVAPSFTVLSPPMGLDFFAVLDGPDLSAATPAATGESQRLLKLLRDTVATQVYSELCSDNPRFLDVNGTSRDNVFRWWVTTLREAFQAFHEEVPAYSQGRHGEDALAATTATTVIALVLEKYLVIGSYGASKAVLSRGGELVELSSDSLDMGNKSVAGDGRMTEATSKSKAKLPTALQTATDAPGSSAPAPAPAAPGVVDVVAVERDARFEFLILASQAFWDKVTPAAAFAHVRRKLGRTLRFTIMQLETRIADKEGSPMATRVAEELAEKALHAGSQDNVSVVLVVFRDFWARNQRN